jgi:hypothetical protein
MQLLAQYGGGNGRGEMLAAISTYQVNGKMLSLYAGGSGRGEKFSQFNSSQLNGKIRNLYGGSNGRGEILTAITTSQLNGDKLNLYGGGYGRGETLVAANSVDLKGSKLNLYNGGNGRGEIFTEIGSNQLNGVMTLMFLGGNGRGETVNSINTLQLDGLTASIYIGGNGKGETMIQLDNQGLPAELACFAATRDLSQIRVYWQTTKEKNSDYFTVEKSADSSNWQPMGKVNAAVNSNTLQGYQLFDTKPVDGVNYYRLKTTAMDGRFIYSPIASVFYLTGFNGTLSVFPNPAKYEFTLSLKNNKKVFTNINITLFSANGEAVLQKQNLTGNTQTINVTALPPGAYYLMVTANGEIYKVQVIKE